MNCWFSSIFFLHWRKNIICGEWQNDHCQILDEKFACWDGKRLFFKINKQEKSTKTKLQLHRAMLDVPPTLENKNVWLFFLGSFSDVNILFFTTTSPLFGIGFKLLCASQIIGSKAHGTKGDIFSTVPRCSTFPSGWIMDHREEKRCPVSALSCQQRTGQTHTAWFRD